MSSSKLSEEILYNGRILDLARETHQMPDGREARFEVVQHPGGAAALPILPDGRLILIHQFRPAIEDYILEIPAGRLEPGEDGVNRVTRYANQGSGVLSSAAWANALAVIPVGTTFSAGAMVKVLPLSDLLS